MSFPRYPSYKGSGVEWMGEVPAHWELPQIKRTTYLKARVGWKGLTSEEFREKAFAYLVTGSDFREKFVKWDACYQVEQDRYEDDPFIQLKDGDLLITKDGTIGKLAIVSNLDRPACLNSGIFVARPQNTYTTEFMYWVLSSSVFSVFCDLESFGSTINHLYQNVFERFTFPAPPLSEQTQIATFLDRETAKIDTLVAEQRRLMDLLKEKRQAVISHAVTRGLNPDAPMKPSGIERIGQIPARWNVVAIKRFSTLHRGYDLTDAERSAGLYPVVTSSGINGTHGSFMARGPGVVTGRYGSTGRLFYIQDDFWPHNTSLYVSSFHGNHVRFVWYSLQTIDFSAHSAKAAVPGIDRNDIHVLPIVVPPQEEQAAIASFLDGEMTKLETLTTEAQRAIDLLQERRTALISAAVMGQIDVRGGVHADVQELAE